MKGQQLYFPEFLTRSYQFVSWCTQCFMKTTAWCRRFTYHFCGKKWQEVKVSPSLCSGHKKLMRLALMMDSRGSFFFAFSLLNCNMRYLKWTGILFITIRNTRPKNEDALLTYYRYRSETIACWSVTGGIPFKEYVVNVILCHFLGFCACYMNLISQEI